MYPECRHIKTNGLKCKSPALRGMAFCYYHARYHRAANGTKPFRFRELNTTKNIQDALAKVLITLQSPRLDPRRAELCIWGLQLAAQLANQDPPSEISRTGPPQFPPSSIPPQPRLLADSSLEK